MCTPSSSTARPKNVVRQAVRVGDPVRPPHAQRPSVRGASSSTTPHRRHIGSAAGKRTQVYHRWWQAAPPISLPHRRHDAGTAAPRRLPPPAGCASGGGDVPVPSPSACRVPGCQHRPRPVSLLVVMWMDVRALPMQVSCLHEHTLNNNVSLLLLDPQWWLCSAEVVVWPLGTYSYWEANPSKQPWLGRGHGAGPGSPEWGGEGGLHATAMSTCRPHAHNRLPSAALLRRAAAPAAWRQSRA